MYRHALFLSHTLIHFHSSYLSITHAYPPPNHTHIHAHHKPSTHSHTHTHTHTHTQADLHCAPTEAWMLLVLCSVNHMCGQNGFSVAKLVLMGWPDTHTHTHTHTHKHTLTHKHTHTLSHT